MRRTALLLAATLVAFVAGGLPSDAAPAPKASDSPEAASVDASLALVELGGDPLATSPRTRPPHGKKIDFSSNTVKSERARLSAIRNEFKQWLQRNAPKARVTKEFDLAVHAVGVQLNGTPLATLRSAPDVRSVEPASIYRPLAHDDPDLALINALEGWTAAGGEAEAGDGVKVAVIDTGIDASHPCFDDAGYPAQTQLGDTSLTNNKVIAAKVFYNKQKKDGVDASAVNDHGTHVAGIVACNAHTPAVVDDVDIPYDPSGVAPRALLGNYNVFPGETGEARSEDILDAMEEAYEDGFDVINMSLGGPHNSGGNNLNSRAVDNLDRANVVVAVAAGKDGPDGFTVGYPGAAARALTAGASNVGHTIVNQLTVGGASYQFVTGDFAELTADITAPLHVVPDAADPDQFPHGLTPACDEDPPLPDLTGKIAMVGRGVCDFTVKVRNAQNAGAVGVIVADREDAPLFVMSHNGLEPVPTIPAVLVTLADAAAIDDHHGEPVTLHALGVYERDPAADNLMASFSSEGPVLNTLAVKPDLVAPGGNVISALPASTCSTPPCWGFKGGTSMASPHLAGAAAVVRGLHADWSAAQVRSAIVNTAQEGVLRDSQTDAVTDDVTVVGAGLLDLAAATGATAALDPVSTAFGAFTKNGSKPQSSTVTVTNIGTATRIFSATIADDGSDGVLFSGSSSFTLAPGEATTVTVTVTPSSGLVDGPRQAFLRVLADGTEVAHSAVFVFVGSGARAPGPHNIHEQ